MLELLTDWLPLLLAGFATGAVLAARARARRDRADFALELLATQRALATTYCQAIVNAIAATGSPPRQAVIRSLADLVELDWLDLEEVPGSRHLRGRVRDELAYREGERRAARLYAATAGLQASLAAMARTAVQDY